MRTQTTLTRISKSWIYNDLLIQPVDFMLAPGIYRVFGRLPFSLHSDTISYDNVTDIIFVLENGTNIFLTANLSDTVDEYVHLLGYQTDYPFNYLASLLSPEFSAFRANNSAAVTWGSPAITSVTISNAQLFQVSDFISGNSFLLDELIVFRLSTNNIVTGVLSNYIIKAEFLDSSGTSIFPIYNNNFGRSKLTEVSFAWKADNYKESILLPANCQLKLSGDAGAGSTYLFAWVKGRRLE